MTPFETYSLFYALKLHINNDRYNFYKYNGIVNTSIEKFNKRNDKYFFSKLSKKFSTRDEMIFFIISNLLENDNIWIGDLLTPNAEEVYKQRKKKFESIEYIFKEECEFIFKDIENPHDLLKPKQGELPELLQLYNKEKVSLETLVVINILINYIDGMDKRVTDTIQYPIIRKRILKYTSFLSIKNLNKYKTILKRCVYHD